MNDLKVSLRGPLIRGLLARDKANVAPLANVTALADAVGVSPTLMYRLLSG